MSKSDLNPLWPMAPVRICPATSRARSTSAVNTAPCSPKMVSLAMRTASASSSAAITESTGPKISSCAMTDLLSTLPNTVGSMYQPRSRSFGRPPPVARVAPSSMPLAM
jgi:hypothetical protein